MKAINWVFIILILFLFAFTFHLADELTDKLEEIEEKMIENEIAQDLIDHMQNQTDIIHNQILEAIRKELFQRMVPDEENNNKPKSPKSSQL